MAANRKSMLEAFRKADELSSAEESKAKKPKAPAPSAPAVEPAPAPAPAEAPRATSEAPGGSGAPLAGAGPLGSSRYDFKSEVEGGFGAAVSRIGLPVIMLWAASLAFAFAGGILVGRGSDTAQAAETTSEGEGLGELGRGGDAPAGLVPGGWDDARSARDPEPYAAPARSSSEDLLYDPANQYTIVVVTYGATQTELAWSAYDHLQSEGMPVFKPYRVGDNLVLFVGAAPESDDLETLEREVRGLSRDGYSRVYDDAFRIKIDNYVDR